MIKTPLSTMIGGAFWTPSAMILGGASKTLNQIIKSLFANNEQGFFYDPNDLSTMYQDAAGTVPVTAVGQPVGLVLDKSKGLVLGGNVFVNTVNGYFDSGSTTELLTGTLEKTTAWMSVNPDTFYKIETNGSSADRCRIQVKNASGVISYLTQYSFEGNATYPRYAKTNSDSVLMRIYFKSSAGNATGLIIRAITGNHAYQTVSASRPVLRQTPILGSELVVNGDFSNGLTSWSYTDANVTNEVLNVVSTGTAWRHAYQNVNVTVGKTYLLSLKVLKSGADNCYVTYGPLSNESSLNANIAQATTLQYKSYIFTATEATHRVRVQNGSATAGFTVSADDISVREITGYRTDQNYLAFDGVDDFLQTNNIDFTATDKVSLFAGVRKLSDVDAGTLLEFSSAISNVGTFALQAPSAVNGRDYVARANGTPSSIGNARYIGADAPHSAVLTSLINLSEADKREVSLRVNNSAYSYNSTATDGGNFSSSILYIGRRAGSVYQFNGHLYSLIGISRLTTDSETIALEKSIAKNTGVTLNV